MKVYIVQYCDYDYDSILGVFADEAAAVKFARAEARTSNEEFTGSIGGSVLMHVFDTDNPTEVLDEPDWRDWKVKAVGARFFLDTDT